MATDIKSQLSRLPITSDMAILGPMDLSECVINGDKPEMILAWYADRNRYILSFISISELGDYQVSILVPLPGKREREYLILKTIEGIVDMKSAKKVMRKACREMPMMFGMLG